jgi:hypothetical protein
LTQGTAQSRKSGTLVGGTADFLLKLAHATTDAGADVFRGRGASRLRAIEIYQGKPPPSLKDSTEKFTD